MQRKFDFFETVCRELEGKESVVLTRDDFGPAETDGTLIEDLEIEMGISDSPQAIKAAVEALTKHFELKGGRLPFEYDVPTGRFKTRDADYIAFVAQMSGNRGVGRESKQFEVGCSDWISRRLQGDVHRVGWPRSRNKKRDQFVKHLKGLGFGDDVAYGKEKDAGFDIVWLPPLGSVPRRLVVSIQCKNGEYDLGEADKSVGAVTRSFNVHEGLDKGVHVPCVLFNDYITEESLPHKPMNFLPLGLSDFVHNQRPAALIKL